MHEAHFEDLDPDLLAQFVEHLGDHRPVEEILYRDYRLIDFHNGRPRLTLAALLLFARDPLPPAWQRLHQSVCSRWGEKGGQDTTRQTV